MSSHGRGLTGKDVRWLVVLLLVVLIGAALRAYRLGEKELWYDEWMTALHATRENDLFTVIRDPLESLQIPAPPLYFIITHFFNYLGEGPFFLRLPVAFVGVLSIPMIYMVGKTLFGQQEALLAAFLLAVSSYHIRYSQEARYYSMMLSLSLSSLFFLYRGMRRNDRLSWLGFALTMLASLYLHLFAAFFFLAEGLWVLTWLLPLDKGQAQKADFARKKRGRQKRASRWPRPIRPAHQRGLRYWLRHPVSSFTLCGLIICILYLPMVPFILRGARGARGLGGEPSPFTTMEMRDFLPTVFSLFGAGMGLPLYLYAAALAGGLLSLGLEKRWKLLILAMLWSVVPFLILLVVPARHAFRLRYLIFILPVFLLMVARGLTWLVGALARRWPNLPSSMPVLGAAALALLLGGFNVTPVGGFYSEQKQPWRKAFHYLETVAQPGEIVVTAGEDAARWLALYGFSTTEVVHLKSCPCPTQAAVEVGEVTQYADRYDGVWFIHFGAERALDWLAPNGVVERESTGDYVFTMPALFQASRGRQRMSESILIGPYAFTDIPVLYVARREFLPTDQEVIERTQEWLDQATTLYPDQVRSEFVQGELYRRFGQDEEAPETYYQAAIEADPAHRDAYMRQIGVYAAQERPLRILDLAELARERDVISQAEYHQLRGDIYGLIGHLDMAIEEYQRAVRLAPAFASLRLGLARLYGQQGAVDKALAEVQAAVEIEPENALAHLQLGQVYLQLGRQEEGLSELRTATHLDPDDHFLRALVSKFIYEGGGPLAEVRAELEAAVRLAPDVPHYRLSLAMLYQQEGNLDQALEESQEAARLDPDLAQAHYVQADILKQRGELDEAIERYQEAVQIEPGQVPYHLGLADAYQLAGQTEAAIAEYERVLKLDPANPTAQQRLAGLR